MSRTAAALAPAMAPLVLFDLDGTLVDSAIDLAAAVNDVRAELALPAVPVEQVRGAISAGARAILTLGLPELPEDDRYACVESFLAFYIQRIGHGGGLFDGIADLLALIEDAGSRWGVVTNKREDLAHRVMDQLGLSGRCAVLIGGDTLERCKPDPLPVLTACQRVGVAPQHTVFIGDDQRDVQAGRAAGCRTIAVRWGFHPAGDDPDFWGADLVVGAPIELLRAGALATA